MRLWIWSPLALGPVQRTPQIPALRSPSTQIEYFQTDPFRPGRQTGNPRRAVEEIGKILLELQSGRQAEVLLCLPDQFGPDFPGEKVGKDKETRKVYLAIAVQVLEAIAVAEGVRGHKKVGKADRFHDGPGRPSPRGLQSPRS